MRNYIIGFVIGVAATLLLLLWLAPCRDAGAAGHAATAGLEVTVDSAYATLPPQAITVTGKARVVRRRPVPRKVSALPALQGEGAAEPQPAIGGVLGSGGAVLDSCLPKPDRAFVALLDTLIIRDSISLRYEYPRNYFTLQIRRPADSVLFRRVVVKQSPERWWVKPAIALSAAALGVLAGRASK